MKKSKNRKLIVNVIFYSMGIILLLLNMRYVAVSSIRGSSMQPYLYEWDTSICNPFDRNFERYDVVTLTNVKFVKGAITKRIVGLPGEHVLIQDDKIYINNVEVENPYTVWGDNYDSYAVKLGDDEYIILGDNNIGGSLDSLYVRKPVKDSSIVGKQVLKIPTHKVVDFFKELFD